MSSLQFIPQLSLGQTAAFIATAVLAWFVIRGIFGRSATIAQRWPLTVLRACVLGLLALLFLNPVHVTETPGEIQRPEMFYLLDSSASMQMGSGSTRWKDSLNMIQHADRALSMSTGANIRLTRFGRRLSAIESPDQLGLQLNSGHMNLKSDASVSEPLPQIKPEDADSRLLQALRRISSRFGRKPPAGIVLFTDGQVRDGGEVLALAASFRDLGVPIHVAPQGNLSGGGDVAIVGVVAPRRVRKYSEVEVNVFLRSFGYDGATTELQLVTTDDSGLERTLDKLPVTLKSGFQSKVLKFRSDVRDQSLQIRVAPRDDEIASNNNVFTTEIMVDRTKIRVLYLEGTRQAPRSVMRNGVPVIRYPFSDLHDALSTDSDIESVVLMASGTELVRTSETNSQTARGFPETLAELAAFDAIILSNVNRDMLNDRELEWIQAWISQRGGGLMMIGGENSFASGGWNDTKVAGILPVTFNATNNDWNPAANVKFATTGLQAKHAIWHLMDDEQQCAAAIQELPEFTGANAGLRIKPGISTTLATATGVAAPAPRPTGLSRILTNVFSSAESTGQPEPGQSKSPPIPVLAAGQYGKGRSLAMGVAITAPWAPGFSAGWGPKDNGHYGKFWRNIVYWLTEASSIGRRRLTLATDKRYYQPGDKLRLIAHAFDEQSRETQDYRIEAIIEPQELPDDDSFEAPVRWPDDIPRTSGEEGPLMTWGEVLTLPKSGADSGFELELELADSLISGSASQALRFEMVAYQDETQVDSTSLDVQILHDPFEQQNPFPNHELLNGVAKASGGSVLNDTSDLVKILEDLTVETSEPKIHKQPAWSMAWVMLGILGLLTGEWLLRRHYGLA